VITANSPASQAEHPANWQATLWHEFCHVVTLKKTNNKMPRWLSEGISVFEERQADATWGQKINPRFRELVLSDALTPVSLLSGAFLHPPTPLHLQFAYYESSLVVEYIVEKYGFETLKKVLVDLGAGMPINDALGRSVDSLGVIDREFAEYAQRRAGEMAPLADWSQPDLPSGTDTASITVWVDAHPHNYRGLELLAKHLIDEKRFSEALAPLEEMARLYPDNGGAGNPFALLATIHRELGQTDRERAALEKLASLTADDADALKRLADMSARTEDWPATLAYASRTLAINPLQASPHRNLASAAEHSGNRELAIGAYNAMLLLDPIDPAEIHFRLATHLHRAGELDRAKRHVLAGLEIAPRFREALRELLEIVGEIERRDSPSQPAEASAAQDSGKSKSSKEQR
jgi:tetratricopeptide (TPR) repeat protein